MIERYQDSRIAAVWSLENKYKLWQDVELAFLRAQVSLGQLEQAQFDQIKTALEAAPINAGEIHEIEQKTRHDLNAFVEERRQHIPKELQRFFHRGNTSYDTEEPAMALMLQASYDVVAEELGKLQDALQEQAGKHHHTVMFARTHGQEAELQTFGKRLLGYFADLEVDKFVLHTAHGTVGFSKFSGATGNYTTVSPDTERATLKELDLEPFVGATQIVPREVYTPLAMALVQLTQTIHKIALGIRLGGRSGRPLCHEPFGKGQMGSSAMPHKKNTIITEQLEGMARLALGYGVQLMQNISTWEERAIEQSCVERVAWPDLFHVTVHSLKRLTYVISGLVVYPQNMFLEVAESGGIYASNEAKGLLKELGQRFDLADEDAYRIIQLAAFTSFEGKQLHGYKIPQTLEDTDTALEDFGPETPFIDFKEVVVEGRLAVSPHLQADQEMVDRWNSILRKIFNVPENWERWQKIFQPSYILRNEVHIYNDLLEAEDD